MKSKFTTCRGQRSNTDIMGPVESQSLYTERVYFLLERKILSELLQFDPLPYTCTHVIYMHVHVQWDDVPDQTNLIVYHTPHLKGH